MDASVVSILGGIETAEAKIDAAEVHTLSPFIAARGGLRIDSVTVVQRVKVVLEQQAETSTQRLRARMWRVGRRMRLERDAPREECGFRKD